MPRNIRCALIQASNALSTDRPLEQIRSALGYCLGLWRGLELSGLCHSYVSFSSAGILPPPSVEGTAMPSDAENFSSS